MHFLFCFCIFKKMAKMLVNDFQSQNVNYFREWLDQSGLGKLKVEEF